MTHSYIAYKRADELRVGRIARALEQCGIEVWWDRELPGGESWRENLEEWLDAAGCVVVIWSHASLGPDNHYVLDEARRGLARDALVPVSIDRVTPPLGFGEIQSIDLCHWKGKLSDPFFQDLVSAIRAKLSHQPVPPPAGPTARVRRRLFYSALSSVGTVALITFTFNAFGVATRVCTVPGLQPGLSDACGAARLGGRPSKTERLAWAAMPAGSCPALREHVRRFPDGAYRSEAADLLAARRVSTRVRWTPVTRQLALTVLADAPAPSEAVARSQAIARATPDAVRLCRLFGSGTLFRYVSAGAKPETWSCASRDGGTACGFDGTAECTLALREQIEDERCGPKG